jgi:hypothetical protein
MAGLSAGCAKTTKFPHHYATSDDTILMAKSGQFSTEEIEGDVALFTKKGAAVGREG